MIVLNMWRQLKVESEKLSVLTELFGESKLNGAYKSVIAYPI